MTAAQPSLSPTQEPPVRVIEPLKRWQPLDLRELWQYREMMVFLIWRDIRVRYRQTILGALWAVIQPFITMIVFTFVFGRIAKMPSDGIPYPLFSYVGLLPWNFFSTGLSKASTSLVSNSSLIRKIYFPRLVLPITAIVSGITDFLLSLAMLVILYVYYAATVPTLLPTGLYPVAGGSLVTDLFASSAAYFHITLNILWVPVLLLLAFLSSLAVSLWLAALNASFRDIGYALGFVTRMLLYLTPVIYPISALPSELRLIAALNPITGVVEGFRWAMLGAQTAPGPYMIVATAVTLVLLVTGAFYFRRIERTFADIV
jgi:lipopolysaccharide transport system permease protein